jgi:BirA family biotin operon repressor/biotin-[acetyl-CoA-carboxylase] ligase
MSVLLFPLPALRRPVILAAWAATSVCETIHETAQLEAEIKWPNDVLIRGRKVSGILIEQSQGTVAGIGLNVNQSDETFAQAGLPLAGSLATITGRRFDCREIARLLIRRLDELYDGLCGGDLYTVQNLWRRASGLIGKEVVVEGHIESHRGILREMNFDGLVVEVPGSSPLLILPETVKHIARV